MTKRKFVRTFRAFASSSTFHKLRLSLFGNKHSFQSNIYSYRNLEFKNYFDPTLCTHNGNVTIPGYANQDSSPYKKALILL